MVTIIKQGSKKDSITKVLNRLSKKSGKGIDTHKYSGLIRLKKDPVDIQKELRNEWK